MNKYQPHVLVLPEDDANLQLANEFHAQVDWNRQRQMQVLPSAGGWNEVLKRFELEHMVQMGRWPRRFMVLLIDFDDQQDRLTKAKAKIPTNLTERVFILGALSEPEALRSALGSYETIGSVLADDCREGRYTTWGHQLLRHNTLELDRLRRHVRPILFPSI